MEIEECLLATVQRSELFIHRFVLHLIVSHDPRLLVFHPREVFSQIPFELDQGCGSVVCCYDCLVLVDLQAEHVGVVVGSDWLNGVRHIVHVMVEVDSYGQVSGWCEL